MTSDIVGFDILVFIPIIWKGQKSTVHNLKGENRSHFVEKEHILKEQNRAQFERSHKNIFCKGTTKYILKR